MADLEEIMCSNIVINVVISQLAVHVLLSAGCSRTPKFSSLTSLARRNIYLCRVNGNLERFDSVYEICCNNKLQQRLQGQQCCGLKQFYYSETSICCNNTILDRFICPSNHPGCSSPCSQNDVLCREQQCCGNKSIIKSESLCCFDKEFKLTEQQKRDADFIRCCNETHFYDLRTQICCSKKVYRLDDNKQLRCCGDKTYLPQKNTCLKTLNVAGNIDYVIRDIYEAVCGDDQIYNRRNQGCCNGIVHDTPEINPMMILEPNPDFQCCDGLIMSSREKCCRKHHYYYFPTHTIPNDEDLECCGTGFYNKTTELCKNGTKIKKQFDKELCGYDYYDPKVEGCCEFTVYPKDKLKCCEGSKKTVVSLDMECCNGEGINVSYICCKNFLPAKKKGLNDECCFNEDYTKVESYNQESGDRCVNGSVIEGYPKHTEPCGQRHFYYPSKQICCDDIVYDNSWGCCDGRAYNLEHQTCCFNHVYSLPSTESSCCNIDMRAYKSYDTSNPCLSPCGTTFFDTDSEVCCKDKVYSQKDNFECCGNLYINSNQKQCCGDKYPYKNRGHMKCCDKKILYNAKAYYCEKPVVVPYYTNKLCQPRVLKSFQKIKQLACKTKYGVIGIIESVIVKRTNVPDTNMLIINATVKRWLKSHKNNIPYYKHRHHRTLAFNIQIQRSSSQKCPKYLPIKAKIMIFFDTEPQENTVTINRRSKVFLSRYTPKNEQEILSCKSKVK